jgi:hypothetical protein
MAVCAACRAEFLERLAYCPRCGEPRTPQAAAAGGGRVVVFAGPPVVAEIVGSLLSSAGIASEIPGVETAVIAPAYVSPAGVVRVMVAERDGPRAREIIRQAKEGSGGAGLNSPTSSPPAPESAR